MARIELRRIYAPAGENEGFVVLVDSIWPRGISKERAGVDSWAKSIAPSSELRRWFGHIPDRFPEFESRYEHELDENPDVPGFLDLLGGHDRITLVYAAKDELHNNAVVLSAYLASRV